MPSYFLQCLTPHAAVNNLYIKTPEDGQIDDRNM